MDISIPSLIGGTLFFCAVPLSTYFRWMLQKSRHIHATLEVPVSKVYCSKLPFILFLAMVGQFFQGYLMGYLFDIVPISDPTMMAVIVGLCLALNTWSPFLQFKTHHPILITLWGLYSHMDPSLFLILPVMYLLIAFLVNSFELGLIVTILGIYGVLWMLQIPIMDWILNSVILLITFLRLSEKLFDHFENKPLTILRSFQNR